MRPGLPLLWLMVCALAGVTARAELSLTNYTVAHPLKVLPIGDSITDDVVTNGAWRAYLQNLLASNGYAFTNLGRWSSIPMGAFTQIHHEGIDGQVIAAPGVFGPAHGYSQTNNYALLTVADALASGENPDLVLIDLGVNDMGRGRDPHQTATNDLSALLDLVFSNLPSAHVIVSKPTSITFSSISSPPYDTYFTNMYTFCDGVQAVAAARRARGQNVFVADLFSAVHSPTMLNSDGTHPNAAGLAALAGEMMFRIASVTSRTDSVVTPFVPSGSVWKYNDQGPDLGTNWSQTNYDDSAWSQGSGRLGYNTIGITTTVGFGPVSTNKYITTYFRHTFAVPYGVSYTNLNLRLNFADGAAVWLNGQALYRVNLPAGTINYQTHATQFTNEINDASNTYFPTNLPIASLPVGTNVIAVEIHKFSPGAANLTFDLELFGQGVYLPPPTLSVTATPSEVRLSWPTNYTGFGLQTVSNLSSGGAWQQLPGPYPVNDNSYEVSVFIHSNTAQFFRLMKLGQ